eukprot:4721261-Pyramimonas_sp.AAC.1
MGWSWALHFCRAIASDAGSSAAGLLQGRRVPVAPRAGLAHRLPHVDKADIIGLSRRAAES